MDTEMPGSVIAAELSPPVSTTLWHWKAGDNRVNSCRPRHILHCQEFLLLDGEDVLPLLSCCLSLPQAPPQLVPGPCSPCPPRKISGPSGVLVLSHDCQLFMPSAQEAELNSLPLEYELVLVSDFCKECRVVTRCDF